MYNNYHIRKRYTLLMRIKFKKKKNRCYSSFQYDRKRLQVTGNSIPSASGKGVMCILQTFATSLKMFYLMKRPHVSLCVFENLKGGLCN